MRVRETAFWRNVTNNLPFCGAHRETKKYIPKSSGRQIIRMITRPRGFERLKTVDLKVTGPLK